jgi:16S rRNA C967 or C1407 C5-methylase (RsmB/RsmF family)/NOL1/NOP2/fmu family ribosome biogenesis protein
MQLPSVLLDSLKDTKGFDRTAFEKVHESGKQVTCIRINPGKLSIENCLLSIDARILWVEHGYYLTERPSFTFDPLFHAGCYYVQEASSMFLEQALKQTVDLSKPLRVLDLCAAPGGKSTHMQSLISSESLLVSNEVIKSRCNILKDNIIKWGCENVIVTNNDPKDFARLENYFDVIVVDAPCSGSGLFRKEPDAIEHWSENNVALCSQRQQRILADVWPALKKDGILIYSTCSYSKEEDEDIVKWMNEEFSVADCQLLISENWGVTKTDNSFRFWPDKVKGEGFFISVFKKLEDGDDCKIRITKKLNEISVTETESVRPWLTGSSDKLFVQGFDGIYAIYKKFQADINLLYSTLRVAYFGVKLGELMKNKLVPAHSLAMSRLLADSVIKIDLNLEQAIRYLQKKDIDVEKNQPGWQLICFESHPLGWVKVMPNRLNNYYPMELRILKDN